jgi:hypothetical protein
VELREARRKNQAFLRWAPLILLVLVGLVMLLLAALSHSGQAAQQAAAPELRASGPPVMVSLGSGEALLGLSENNKDATLQLCWRVSDKPTTECRISYLEAQHEFPARKIAFPAMTVMATEVSNAQYEACVAAGGCKARALDRCEYHSIFRWEMGQPVPAEMLEPERPAVCVVYEEAAGFCKAQSLRDVALDLKLLGLDYVDLILLHGGMAMFRCSLRSCFVVHALFPRASCCSARPVPARRSSAAPSPASAAPLSSASAPRRWAASGSARARS